MSWEREEADRLDRAASTLQGAADDLERSVRWLTDRVADVHGRPRGWIGAPADRHMDQMQDQCRRAQSERDSLRSVAESMRNRARDLRHQADVKDAAAKTHH